MNEDKIVHWFCMGPGTQLVPKVIKGIYFFGKKGNLPEDQCIAACESMVYAYMYLELFILISYYYYYLYIHGIAHIFMNLEWLKALHIVQCTYTRYFSLT